MNKSELELAVKIKKIIGYRDLEDEVSTVEVDGTVYRFEDEKDEGWGDQGKFSSKVYTVSVHKGEEQLNFYLSQYVSRDGSHYTGYEYDYQSVEICEKKTELVEVTKYITVK